MRGGCGRGVWIWRDCGRGPWIGRECGGGVEWIGQRWARRGAWMEGGLGFADPLSGGDCRGVFHVKRRILDRQRWIGRFLSGDWICVERVYFSESDLSGSGRMLRVGGSVALNDLLRKEGSSFAAGLRFTEKAFRARFKRVVDCSSHGWQSSSFSLKFVGC